MSAPRLTGKALIAAYRKPGAVRWTAYREKRAKSIWRAMRDRCGNPKATGFSNYGERGIAVCQRWQTFQNFLDDMGYPPDGHCIERKSNKRGYYKANCRWATMAEQARNKRTNRLVTIGGVTKCLTDWCAERSINPCSVYFRVNKGETFKQALARPTCVDLKSTSRLIAAFGETKQITVWAKEYGIAAGTIRYRLKHGESSEDAISTPRHGYGMGPASQL